MLGTPLADAYVRIVFAAVENNTSIQIKQEVFVLKQFRWQMSLFLALTLAMLTTQPAAALFGIQPKEEAPAAAEGAPIARELEISAYRGVPYTGQFQSNTEGVTYALADEPKKGTVTVEGDSFTYTSEKTGSDSFTYTATDADGKTSSPATVKITVTKAKTPVTYADLEGSAAQTAAIRLAECGVFTGANVGGSYFFEPDRAVSRGEFLAMTMETAGLAAEEAVNLTGFSDDEAIPTWAKSYATAAVEEGVIRGVTTDAGVVFSANSPISFNEAATILNRVLSVSDVDVETWYADRDSVPSWAAQAVGNMESVNVLATGSFGSTKMSEQVTRADAAQMLCAAKTLLEGKQTGFFDWLGE